MVTLQLRVWTSLALYAQPRRSGGEIKKSPFADDLEDRGAVGGTGFDSNSLWAIATPAGLRRFATCPNSAVGVICEPAATTPPVSWSLFLYTSMTYSTFDTEAKHYTRRYFV